MIARVLVTRKCNRACPGCSNKHPVFDSHKKVADIREVLAMNPETIVLTGGEPMMKSQVRNTMENLLTIVCESDAKVVLYSATFDPECRWAWVGMLNTIKGLSFTVHEHYSDRDIQGVIELTKLLKHFPQVDSRLNIDGRAYDKVAPLLGDLAPWRKVRRLEWKDECKLPDDEKLFVIGQ